MDSIIQQYVRFSNMNDIKSNRELYRQYIVTVFKLLVYIFKLFIVCRNVGIFVSKGIRNIFEFIWEEFIIDFMVFIVFDILGLEISVGVSFLVLMESIFMSVFIQKKFLSLVISFIFIRLVKFIFFIVYDYLLFFVQDILYKFQRQFVYLLIELFSLKMKVMMEFMVGKVGSLDYFLFFFGFRKVWFG